MAAARRSGIELALVHAPVALFALPVPALAALAASSRGLPRWACLLAVWWCLSGAAMMVVDGRARRLRYERIAALASRRPAGFRPPGLGGTVCGLCMSWALRYRRSAGNRTSIQEGVDG